MEFVGYILAIIFGLAWIALTVAEKRREKKQKELQDEKVCMK